MKMHQLVLSTSAVAMGLGATAGCTIILGLNNDYQEAPSTGGGGAAATTTGSVNQNGHGGSTAMSSVSSASSNVTTTGGGGGTGTSGIGGSIGMGGAEATASASGAGGAGGGPLCMTGTTRSCYTGPNGTQDKGACKSGVQNCANNIWGDCKNEVTPSPFEVCNSIDDDCNGAIDDGNPGGGQACSTGNFGICSQGVTMCTSGSLVCKQNLQPTTEICNGLDDDCNGAVDNGNPGGGQTCATGKLGVCSGGTLTCLSGSLACEQNTQSSTEICNGLDDDCNGTVDNGNPGGGQACSTGKLGVCSAGTTMCMSGAVTCKQDIQPSNEKCDNLDNDCNGIKDEGIPGSSCSTGQKGVCALGHQFCDSGDMFCEADNDPIPEVECNHLDDDCDGYVDECFVAGTNVYMADGSQRPIEQVQVGDWVVGYNISAGSILVAPVVHTFIHPLHAQSRSIVRINENLRATTNHPFYANGRWINAEALSLGDSLLILKDSDGVSLMVSQGAVSSLIVESERETTFNIEVAGVHSYFAGGVLVHNKSPCP